MGDFEWALTAALNSYFEANGIKAIAYRLKQSRFVSQFIDILVDSSIPEYYLAIECKSIDARKTKCLYFKQYFSHAGGGHQLERETEFIDRSGRKGILAVELRRGGGNPKTAHLMPWGEVYEIFKARKVGVNLEQVEANPTLERRMGAYEISRLDLVRISGYQDMAMEDTLEEMDDEITGETDVN